jgi:hypothetical protein
MISQGSLDQMSLMAWVSCRRQRARKPTKWRDQKAFGKMLTWLAIDLFEPLANVLM